MTSENTSYTSYTSDRNTTTGKVVDLGNSKPRYYEYQQDWLNNKWDRPRTSIGGDRGVEWYGRHRTAMTRSSSNPDIFKGNE